VSFFASGLSNLSMFAETGGFMTAPLPRTLAIVLLIADAILISSESKSRAVVMTVLFFFR